MTPTESKSVNETDNQRMQDRLWDHYQVEAPFSFDQSYPRLDFFASRFMKGQTVLNIGVGNGYLEGRLYRCGVDVHALDPSQRAMDLLLEKVPLGDKGKVGYSQAIPFPSLYFDGVIMTEVLEHLTDETLKLTLEEVHRVLKPGGIFTGTVPYREDFAANQVICPCCHSVFHRWGHHQIFDKGRLIALLRDADFLINDVYSRAFPDWRRLRIKLLVKSIGRYILGRLGEAVISPNLYFRVKKPPA